MFKSLKKIVTLIVVLVLGACQNSEPKESSEEPHEKNKSEKITTYTSDCKSLFEAAKKSDSIIMSSNEFDIKIANQAIKAFTDFSYYCKSDSLAPVFLIKSAQIAQSINNIPQAQLCLETCINEYPKFKNRGAAMFLLAQMYDDPRILNNEDKAKEIYSNIITAYPGTEWDKNARGARDLLGKSDEEILKEFTKKNK